MNLRSAIYQVQLKLDALLSNMPAFIISLRLFYDIQILFEDSKRQTDTEMTEKNAVITNRLYAAAQLTRM